jgi:hypothetical protein
MSVMHAVLDHVPPGLLDAGPREIRQVLDRPTLIHLPGRRERPLFVSVLLHGNEHTGLTAIQDVLRAYAGKPLPRALSIFVGNVGAAAEGLRRRDGEPDYNRIWPGADTDGTPEHAMARAVFAEMAARQPFAAIDIHNNTGRNPHYGCVNRLEPAFLHLATLFSRIVVHFTRPRGVLSAAFAALCPAVALECGKPGSERAAPHAAEMVDACLHLDHFPAHAVAGHDVDLYRTVGIVRVPPTVDFAFAPPGADEHDALADADLVFPEDLDQLNFRDLPAGSAFALAPRAERVPFEVQDEAGADVTDRHFALESGEVRIRTPLMPAMLTLDARVIRQDCLCYLMQRLSPA